ncbi:MAG: putative quinol monooxygenase, partial [Trebonia sp.]
MTEPDDATASRAWEPGLRSISEPGVPLFMNVTLTIDPERLERFLAALRDVLPAARAEPTCIYLHAGRSVSEPNVFILSEGWRDLVEYRDVILQKPYYQAYLQISESAYAKPRVTQPLIPV